MPNSSTVPKGFHFSIAEAERLRLTARVLGVTESQLGSMCIRAIEKAHKEECIHLYKEEAERLLTFAAMLE